MSYSDEIAQVVLGTWAILGGASVLCFVGAVIVCWWQDREAA